MAGTYIPLIKRTKWVDLSNEHKKLRETVESDLKEGCNKGNIQPTNNVTGGFWYW